MASIGADRANTDHAKALAKLLCEDLAAAGFDIPHSLALELTAHQVGGIPVLRVMSVEAALPFYVDYLGFTLDWEHRFEPGLPLYAQVSRSEAVLHLSEHHGDGSPNGVAWFPVADVFGLHAELLARPNAPLRPGLDRDAPGGPTFQVIDPYGNVLRFAQS
ncbi:catechol 2,3-dioxygenase-like lactoylglutathione lyase family enzyme [Catenulispora sp. GAS73]|uniref:glyoxalase superfamily protein n=1 Tax=Catenulispora sp. GAS73 TaxID=3156269 RepID=UPI003513FF89